MKSSLALQKAKVSGFVSNFHSLAIYGGSVSWLILLILIESTALASSMWSDHIDSAIIASIVLNSITLVAQTIDYVYYHFLFWPITAINWCAQLAAIATASTILSFAVVYTVDADTNMRRWMAVMHLVAQALFTASQFSVTLEYFERRLNQLALPILPTNTHGRRRTTSASR